jgi:transcriptional regulator with XRE-family HTH domain
MWYVTEMRLTDWLKKHDLPRGDFARKISVSEVTVTRYITGSRRPEWDVLQRIVEQTGGAVTADDFLPKPPPTARNYVQRRLRGGRRPSERVRAAD